jgi:hypothetical protein
MIGLDHVCGSPSIASLAEVCHGRQTEGVVETHTSLARGPL